MANLVLIPTYNERENISGIVRAISGLSVPFEILIIDDNSPDGTASIVKEMMTSFPNLHLLERPGKMGLGRAYIAGFEWALQKNYNYIFEMDADFSHNPKDLVRLWDACENGGADLAIGSRYISGVNVVNWPLGRVLMSYIASMYVRLVTGMKIMDTTAGFKCYRREVLQNIKPERIKLCGYGFQIEMKFIAWQLGYKIVEVPIIFTDRKAGTSKMSGSIFGEAMWGVLRMKLVSIFKKPTRTVV
ncbi:MAG: polyprenol monophosphomannose synthase [Bacteroidales bacterium]|jgi:dolichol-phosphate mannosyltransferase|nr:polyprenol monophosphomannose synthase [Bacteroidales bacterium]MDI9533922.1 polyprenol monophosphomannose synthase [Bacteroidota bacterium]OPZ55862.1 MAG: Undecaprenyl-phosphate mannosyltransferase [Bacteroidetes bacterium ADurb.BinA012]MBK7732041.1 polyprenol monophosphomannose synthase [Bacteroidales bacterium]MBP7036414.1 polyprenol monophosphomannose synthase [Bacteroidales bacterium]